MSEDTILVHMSSSQQAVRDHKKRMKDHLERALDEDDLLEKNYYIRSALQDLILEEDDERR